MKKLRAVILASILAVASLACACGGGESNGNGGNGGGNNLPGHTHEYVSEQIIKPATCVADGEKLLTCSCGDTKTTSYSADSATASDIYEEAKKSVGEIITYDKKGAELALGTGFAYTSDGKIVTNYHVIEDAYSATIKIGDVTYPVKSILAYNKTIDLAVLKIDVTGLTVLNICNKEHAVGKAVYAIGSSRGMTATFTQGIITHADREMEGVHYVQHDAAISSGNSGGPLINQFSEIIGINTMTILDSQNLNFAISVKELNNLTYGSPLTFAEFYEKECDSFTKLKNYIVSNGTYDSEDGQYECKSNFITSNSLTYRLIGTYDIADATLQFSLFVASGSYSYMVFIDIDQVDGVYRWSYVDSSDIYMYGNLYASTWTSSSLLAVTDYTGIYTTSLATSTRKLASTMINLLVGSFDSYFGVTGVTIKDLGFVSYN